MKALSIKQPWAYLICSGYKDIENRNWRIGRESAPGFHLELPARIYVHASKTSECDEDTLRWVAERLEPEQYFDVEQAHMTGAIIGEVTITACVTESASRWFVGPYGFVLKDAKLYDRPIPYRGQLGFFEVILAERPKEA